MHDSPQGHEEEIIEVVGSFVSSSACENGNGKIISFHQTPHQSFAISKQADVLIAADVVYDRCVIPQLVQVVKTLLTTTPLQSRIKKAIFATTYRNADTFALFEKEIGKYSDAITCEYVDSKIIEMMPCIFPCYFQQPRNHVRICIISKRLVS